MQALQKAAKGVEEVVNKFGGKGIQQLQPITTGGFNPFAGVGTITASQIEQGMKMLDEYNNSLLDSANAYIEASAANREYAGSLAYMEEKLEGISYIMSNLAEDAVAGLAAQVSNLAAELGALAVTGEFNGDQMLSSFGNFLKQMGGQMAVYGALVMAFGATQQAFMSDPTPWGKLAEGAALLALGLLVAAAGGAISASASGSVSGVSSAGGGTTYSPGTGYYDYNREIVLVARGEDLVAVINRQNYKYNVNG
jgi:hypothetical protein